MVTHGNDVHVTDEERRDFLKALGVVGAVSVGGATLGDVRSEVAVETGGELPAVGQRIRDDLTGTLESGSIADGQAALVAAANELPAALDRGLPVEEPRNEFGAVATAGRPIYDHLEAAGFFESTTEHLPTFSPATLESAVQTFVGSEALSESLANGGLAETEGVDVLAEVVANAAELSDHHWIATDEIPRAEIEFGEYIPPMTQGAAGGALLWLEDLDHYLFTHQVLLTDAILSDAVWHGRSMATGFHLVAEGARAIAAEDAAYSDGELAALLSTGFAVQAIAQGLLPQDVYWIGEEMRDERRTDLQRVNH